MKSKWGIAGACLLLVSAGVYTLSQTGASSAPTSTAPAQAQFVVTGLTSALPEPVQALLVGQKAVAGLAATLSITQDAYKVNNPTMPFALFNKSAVALAFTVTNNLDDFDYFLYQNGKELPTDKADNRDKKKPDVIITIKSESLTDTTNKFRVFFEGSKSKLQETLDAEAAKTVADAATKAKADADTKAAAAKADADKKAADAKDANDKAGAAAVAAVLAQKAADAETDPVKKADLVTKAKAAADDSAAKKTLADAALTASTKAASDSAATATTATAAQTAVQQKTTALTDANKKRDDARQLHGIPITLVLPTADAPHITLAANGRYANLVPFSIAAPVTVYDGFLRVQIAPPLDGLEFFLLPKTGTDVQAASPITVASTEKNKDSAIVTLTIPKVKADTTDVVCRITANKVHAWSSEIVRVAYKDDVNLDNIVIKELAFVSGKDQSAAPSLLRLANSTTVVLGGKVDVTNGLVANANDLQILVLESGVKDPLAVVTSFTPVAGAANVFAWQATVPVPAQAGAKGRTHSLKAQLARAGKTGIATSAFVDLLVQTRGPRVDNVVPANFGAAAGVTKLKVVFNPENPLVNPKNFAPTWTGSKDPNLLALFVLQKSNGSNQFDRGSEILISPIDVEIDTNSALLTFAPGAITPDSYQIEVKGGLQDVFGNLLMGDGKTPGTSFKKVLGAGADDAATAGLPPYPSLSYGITGTTGKNTEFPTFLTVPEFPEGFNPGDKVETRVVRLYYFRDAHRVAQIINRDVKSFNRAAVDLRRRLADQQRDVAEKLTDQRRLQEVKAIQASKEARAAERQLAQQQAAALNLQQQLDFANQAAQAPELLQDDATLNPMQKQNKAQAVAARNAIPGLQKSLEDVRTRIQATEAAVQATRLDEVKSNEQTIELSGKEDLAIREQFRRSVAALHEDPDTYVRGKKKSVDPVLQVSISVIGESELQLRGPIDGINTIREMVNQIDAPAGQVRIAVHTVQVNGEKADRMETVVGNIQQYLDQSRFLTQQSALMLRKAVVYVASNRAEQMKLFCPGNNQAARDQRYVYGFFGQDFIDELKAQDSEFLKEGNKLLGLHSMDTTSLASALFVLALAKNDVRHEILHTFQILLTNELPKAEMNYLEAMTACGKRCKHDKVCLLAQNARFQSFLGFFDAEVTGIDTLTPMQREFIRLAQIFKSRLVTELEVSQRIFERSMVEDRFPSKDYKTLLQDQNKMEKEANDKLAAANAGFRTARGEVQVVLAQISAFVDLIRKTSKDANDQLGETSQPVWGKGYNDKEMVEAKGVKILPHDFIFRGIVTRVNVKKEAGKDDINEIELTDSVANYVNELGKLAKFLEKFYLPTLEYNKWLDAGKQIEAIKPYINLGKTYINLDLLHAATTNLVSASTYVDREAAKIQTQIFQLNAAFQDPNITPVDIYRRWIQLREPILSQVKWDFKRDVETLFNASDAKLQTLLQSGFALQQAVADAQKSRRPLDQKKLLDLLISEAQDKYVELLEGTRAHTSNIDDYIKRVATALEDDFNVQFYAPAFREVRQASRMWDVTLSQIETTSILTNNRSFAKVEPQATMEFDLPKRDILITEAMKSAKGLVDTYGALMQDPTFLTLAKMGSGSPGSSLSPGQSQGLTPIRSVLPGLSRQNDESFLSQQSPANINFGTPLDALVPEPAVYKFETGTGYEVRPVLSPDGQSVVFHFNYMYTTNIREPVRADEKHLGRVKRHFIDTDVQLGNYELREISRYQVALKAVRTGKGVPLLENIPGLGVLFRPLPSAESSLQQNIIMGQATIFPTLFDLMGLRWAPAVADLDPLAVTNADFIVRGRKEFLKKWVFDATSSQVDDALHIPVGLRRADLYRSQSTIPYIHPNGYQGPGLNLLDSNLKEGYSPRDLNPPSKFVPQNNPDGAIYRPQLPFGVPGPFGPPSIPGPPLDPRSGVPVPQVLEQLPKPKQMPSSQAPYSAPSYPTGYPGTRPAPGFAPPSAPNGGISFPASPTFVPPANPGSPPGTPLPGTLRPGFPGN